MDYKDYYRILGVSRQATDKEIKQAYRQLARQFHPDVNPDPTAEDKLKEINEAYAVLSDAEKRRRYDDLGNLYNDWQKRGDSANFDWSRWTQSASRQSPRTAEERSGGVFSDFFNTIFGESTRRDPFVNKAPIRGTDLEMDVTISLEEAFHGTNRQIGRGTRTFEAHIPRGSQTGTKIRFANQGERGFAGGSPGDLYVTIHVTDDPIFERRGDDLHLEIEVPLYSAVLGGEVRLPTLARDVRLKIPPGTQSGQTIRLKGRGMPLIRQENTYGDLYARVLIKIPIDLSPEEIELFEELARLRYSREEL